MTNPGLLRRTGLLRRVAELAVTPLVPADVVDLLAPLSSPTDLRARVVAVEPETADAATLVLRPGRGWRGHVPGQYVRLGVEVDGVRLWRAYSVTSQRGECITVTVKAIPGGAVSEQLVRRTRPGAVLQLDQAAGDFTLTGTRQLFVTGGSGITPVMAMLRSGAVTDAVVVHSALSRAEVVFGGELRAMARDGRIRLVEVHTDTDGLLDVAALPDLVPDLASREVYVCGPAGLMDAVEQLGADLGVPVRAERFRPALAAVGEGGTVSYSGTVVEVDGATTLLDAGESAGVLLPSGCRMGICFGCVLPLSAGAVRDLRTGALTDAGPGVLVQTCVSAAAGPCELEIR